ncbi:hypothetical protein ACTWP5_11955 [Streptomyces sp. 4N509B]|uniref:hypothetical protein n=1 Tax=Streptomyces sp. 4N509B TaxID=3457413 RepID=UPI003FD05BAE
MAVTDQRQLALAEPGDARDLAAFLGRQLGWDRAAAARVTAGGGDEEPGEVVAVFTRPARFDVLAVWPGRLSRPARLDVTVAAGELLEGIDEERARLTVPAAVTGPAWAGVLPPRGGWRRLSELRHDALRAAAAAVVAEFRERTERLAETERTRGALDALAEEIWSRTLGGTPLPLRAVHAAHALGFLRAPDAPAATAGATLLSSGSWLRLTTPLGSIAARRTGVRGLSLTPVPPA